MNPGASVLVPHTDMDEYAWDDLLSFIEERLNVDGSQLPHPYTLNDVVCWFLGARAALAAKNVWIVDPKSDRRMKANVTTLLAVALAGQGKANEARQAIEPVVRLHRELASRNRGDQIQKIEMAGALYCTPRRSPTHSAARHCCGSRRPCSWRFRAR